MNSSWYLHSTLRDSPTMPVTLLGPLRDKQPGKHNQLLVQGRRAGNTKDVGPARGPWGWKRWRQEANVSSDPGKAEEGHVPSSKRRGCLRRREGPRLERTVCVFLGGAKVLSDCDCWGVTITGSPSQQHSGPASPALLPEPSCSLLRQAAAPSGTFSLPPAAGPTLTQLQPCPSPPPNLPQEELSQSPGRWSSSGAEGSHPALPLGVLSPTGMPPTARPRAGTGWSLFRGITSSPHFCFSGPLCFLVPSRVSSGGSGGRGQEA